MAVVTSSTARILKALLPRWPKTTKVDLVTTDGFFWPNAELTRLELFLFKAEAGIRYLAVTGVQTCALPICAPRGIRERDVDGVGVGGDELDAAGREGGRHLRRVVFQVVECIRLVVARERVRRAQPEQRSEESRVGKECRYRWTPYH